MSEYLSGYQDTYKKYGAKELLKKVKNDISLWKTVPLRILVTGESGTGKSSFINAVFGLCPTDKDAAKVGVTETTKVKKEYPHPKYHNVVLIDVPGVGTQNFPKTKYLELIELKTCDFIIIISSSRFKENDAWLASEVRLAEKKFYFVRTKIDTDIRSDMEARDIKEDEIKEDDIVNEVREDCLRELTRLGFENPKIFIMSSSRKCRKKFDFSLLIQQLENDAPSLKKESMMFAVSLQLKPVLKKKKETLRKRIGNVALWACFGSRFRKLKDEVYFYQAQLGIDDKSLQNIAIELGMKIGDLEKQIDLQSSCLLKDHDKFITFCETCQATWPTRTLFNILFSSFFHNGQILVKLLQMCYSESLNVLRLLK